MSKTIPFVSVLIVNYNGKEFITECLDSVLQTDYPKFEIVLVDNGSTDKSCEYISNKYKQELKSKKIRLIKSDKNLYFTGGSNLAAKQAKGEWLIFLNNDTVVEGSWIKELVNAANNPKYLIQPKILFYAKKNTIDNVGGRYIFPGFGFGIGRGEKDKGQYDQTRVIDFANGTCFMIDIDFFWQLGGFDENYQFFYEDVDLNLRAKKSGGKAFCCGKSVIYHRVSQTFKKFISEEEMIFYARKNRLRTVIKNFNGFNKWTRVFIFHTLYIFYKPLQSFLILLSFLNIRKKWWLFLIIYHTLIIKRTFKNWREYIFDCFGLVKNKYSLYTTNDNLIYKVRSNTIDLGILDEVLIKKIYDRVGWPIQPHDTIIDIGAYTGITSLHFARWTKDKVIALEPEKKNFQLLKENVAINKIKNIIPFNQAVSSKREMKELYLSATNPAAHSLFLTVGTDRQKVATITLEEIVKRFTIRSIGLLKIDCEGGEYEILAHCPQEIFTICKNIIIEYHQIDQNHNLSFLKQLLEKGGFYVAVTSFPYNMIYASRL